MLRSYVDKDGNLVMEYTTKREQREMKTFLAGRSRKIGKEITPQVMAEDYILEPVCDELGFYVGRPEWIAALTAAPIILELAEEVEFPPPLRDDYNAYYIEGEVKRVWWYSEYQVSFFLDELAIEGRVVFSKAPEA